MSNFAKCDFCKKEIKWLTPFYQFEMRYSNYTDKRTIDVCKSCYKKFIKSVKTEVFEETNADEEGVWIRVRTEEEGGFSIWKCSKCGCEIYSESEKDRKKYHAFCGACGAKMKEGGNDDE